MGKTKIYLHGEGMQEIEIVEIEESSTIKEIIIAHLEKKGHGAQIEEFDIFIENATEPCKKEDNCLAAGIHKNHKLHLHRCKHIEVVFEYNNKQPQLRVTPGTTGTKLLLDVAPLLNISPNDAKDLKIKLPNGDIMDHDSHIGTYVDHHHHKCGIKLILQEDIKIQGHATRSK